MSDFSGFHHFYIGIFFLTAGFLLLIYGKKTKANRNIAIALCILGFIITNDDVIQHIIQYTDPSYRSPLHKLYGMTLYKVKWIRELNAWADRFFRKL